MEYKVFFNGGSWCYGFGSYRKSTPAVRYDHYGFRLVLLKVCKDGKKDIF
jgi:hypothetical protein